MAGQFDHLLGRVGCAADDDRHSTAYLFGRDLGYSAPLGVGLCIPHPSSH
jgi:hypothetical protein